METQIVIDSIEDCFKALKIDREERTRVLDYIKNGNESAAVPDFGKRKFSHAVLAKTCKPVFAEIVNMQTKSEAFGYAYRFWQYLMLNADFKAHEDFDVRMKEFNKCGLTIKESMLLDLVITDFTPESMSIYHSIPYQRVVFKNCFDKNKKFYIQLRDALFSLTEEETTFNERTRFYYAAFLFGLVVVEADEINTEEDISQILSKYNLIGKLIGQSNLYAVKWYDDYLEEKCYLAYLSFAEKKSGNLAHTLQEKGEYTIPLENQLRIIAGSIDRYEEFVKPRDAFLKDESTVKKIFSSDCIPKIGSEALYYFLEMHLNKGFDFQAVLNCLCYASSKKVVAACSKLIDGHKKEIGSAFKEFIADKKFTKANAEAVKALLDKWADEDNAKSGFADLQAVERFAAGEKLTSAKVLSNFDFSTPVYGKDKKTRVSVQTLKVFLDKYFSMKDVYRNRRCDNMAAHFDNASFQAFIDSVYAVWELSEFESALKIAVVPYCFYTSNANLLKLKKQCVTFCDNNRHTLAAYIIQVIAMNGGKYALMLVDSISNKFPYPKAKQVARDAMAAAADKYDIPIDVLGDMIIPTCDISPNGTLGFGDLTLILQPDGDMQIRRGDKTLKSMPSDVTSERKKEFSAIKKDVKTVLQLQVLRLERALMLGRAWLYRDFERFYVSHPIMRMLVSRLIMGVYSTEGKLITAFRIGLDGKAENADYDEVTLKADDVVALVHPCDLTESALSQWRDYLAENEIKQPFLQILQPVCYVSKELVRMNVIDFSKYEFTSTHLNRLVKKYNMNRLPVEDAGSFAGYYLDYQLGDIGFELRMDELFVMSDPSYGENLSLCFYRPSTCQMDYWMHEEGGYLMPDEVPTRLMSSLLASLAAIMPNLPFETSGNFVPCGIKPFINENELSFSEPEVEVAKSDELTTEPVAASAENDEEKNTESLAAEKGTSAPVKAVKADVKPIISNGESDFDAYLEFVEGTSSKFWKIEVKGNAHTVTFGRIGASGTQSSKTFDTLEAAVSDAKKLTASKIKKGYVQK